MYDPVSIDVMNQMYEMLPQGIMEAFGGGIPILFFVINMFSNVSDNYPWLEYLTLYSIFDSYEIATEEQNTAILYLTFVIIALVLYSAGLISFSRRNLYL